MGVWYDNRIYIWIRIILELKRLGGISLESWFILKWLVRLKVINNYFESVWKDISKN